jgi:hypothetical protein
VQHHLARRDAGDLRIYASVLRHQDLRVDF